jgi:hypothetical protein
MTKAFDPKDPQETLQYEFDFTLALKTGETITSVLVDVFFLNGNTVPSQQDLDGMIDGANSVSGARVFQRITGGVSGNTYVVSVIVTTSLSQEIKQSAILPVISA